MLRIMILAIVVGVGGLAFGVWQLAAQNSDTVEVSGDIPEAPPGATPISVDGNPPPQRAAPTPTLDLAHTVSVEDAKDLLASEGLGGVVEAIEEGSSAALVGQIDWQDQPCGLPRGHTDRCPEGVAAGTGLPMVNVGAPVQFWVTGETVTDALERVFVGPELGLRFASRTDAGTYYLGFEGEARTVSPSPLWGDNPVTGLFIIATADSEHPVREVHVLTPTWSAESQAFALGLTDHEVLVLSR